MMERVTIPKTDIAVSRLSLGTWAFGSDPVWGEQDDQACIDTVAAALECGVNFIDTAAVYASGRSEEILGRALKGRRDQAIVATKVHATLTRDGVVEACERSLKRLQTDYIDLYYIHWPEYGIPLEDTLKGLHALRDAGKIRAVGVSNFGPRTLEDLARAGDEIVSLHQLPYSLFWRAVEYEILPATRALGISGIAYSVLAQGLLTGRYTSYADVPPGLHVTRFYGDGPHGEAGCEAEVFAALQKLRPLAEEAGVSLADLAIQWVLAQPGIGIALTGARTPAEIQANARALEKPIDPAILTRATPLSDQVKAKLGPNPDMWMNAAQTRYR